MIRLFHKSIKRLYITALSFCCLLLVRQKTERENIFSFFQNTYMKNQPLYKKFKTLPVLDSFELNGQRFVFCSDPSPFTTKTTIARTPESIKSFITTPNE